MTRELLLMALFAATGFAPLSPALSAQTGPGKDDPSILSSIPKMLIQVSKEENRQVIIRGKCCRIETYRMFSRYRSQWLVNSPMGFEAVQSRVLEAVRKNETFRITVRDDSCRNCKPVEFDLAPLYGKPHFWRMIGDPVNAGKEKTL